MESNDPNKGPEPRIEESKVEETKVEETKTETTTETIPESDDE